MNLDNGAAAGFTKSVSPERYTWALSVIYCDAENNQFLTLGGAAWRTKRERDANLRHIPAAKTETNYLLDIERPRGVEADRYLTAKTVHALLKKPIAKLIAEARADEEDSWAEACRKSKERA